MSLVIAVGLALSSRCPMLLNEYLGTVYDNSSPRECLFERPWHMFLDAL